MRLPESQPLSTIAGIVAAGALSIVAWPVLAQPPGAGLEARVLAASPYSIAADAELDAYVQKTAAAAIDAHCAACHGADLTGRPGVPNLVDFDWLWGITFEEGNEVGPVMEIQQTILYGIRNEDCPDIEAVSYYGACADTRFSEMPGYVALEALTEDEARDLTEYTVALGGGDADAAAAARGAALWPVCTECHGADGYGHKPYGGPDLTDSIWLFGGDRETIYDVIANGRTQTCPPWKDVLAPAEIKALAVYVWRKASGR